MTEGHSHAPAASAGGRHRTALLVAFCLTAGYMVVEFVVGFAAHSLALISDAAHMGTDVLGLAMALTAITLAARPTGSQRTYGLYRLEVLAALANGLLLFGVAGYVLFEAVQRFREPPQVPGAPLLVVACIGLAVNLVSFRLLSAGSKDSLNLKAASLEVMGDLLGSVGVIAAAVILLSTGWPYADPIIGVAIGLFILPRTALLMRQAVRVLIEAAPPRVQVDALRTQLLAVPGVEEIHDLHVWTITSGMDSVSGHAVLAPDADYDRVLKQITTVVHEKFEIQHCTIQCEPRSFDEPTTALPI